MKAAPGDHRLMKSTPSTHEHDTRSLSIQVERADIIARTLHLISQRRAQARAAKQAVARENVSSARNAPPPSDPRLNLVSEIIRRLQGSMLTHEDRTAIIALGETNGLRRFDINLLIAMIQDRVRRGEDTGWASLVQTGRRPPTPRNSCRREEVAHGTRLVLALIGSAALAMLATHWILG